MALCRWHVDETWKVNQRCIQFSFFRNFGFLIYHFFSVYVHSHGRMLELDVCCSEASGAYLFRLRVHISRHSFFIFIASLVSPSGDSGLP